MRTMLFFIVLFGIALGNSSPAWSEAPGSQPTALDVMEMFMANQGQLDSADIDALLGTAISSNMRIPAEHIGVAFYDTRTNEPLDPAKVREEMGPVRQDGAYQLLQMALQLGGGRLPLNEAQLEALMDAAFISSMRNPPEYISIEFYDRRTGPSGQGGGVSGRVPDSIQTEPEVGPEPSRAGDVDVPPQAFYDAGEIMDKALELGLDTTARKGSVLVPVLYWGREEDELARTFAEYYDELRSIGLYFSRANDPFSDMRRLSRDDDLQVYFGLAWVSGDEAAMQRLRRVFDDINP
ncbi:hypothetical protein [Desulfurispira natronophila]|uniref:DUF2059 domain-containing protein n=1 Tax=Desulfurispira natronophila TaxID=682562 RepID=A0A7W7Y5D6_9BACT|nr:hypothetical protein [Desulfurispira natronophila]MBB5022354.1 hypothetical protein [Desulfurispira natronophila]